MIHADASYELITAPYACHAGRAGMVELIAAKIRLNQYGIRTVNISVA